MLALAPLYDAGPGRFDHVSIPADRARHEHLAQIAERLDRGTAGAWVRASSNGAR